MSARDALFVDPAGTGDNAPGTDATDARLALSGLIASNGVAPLSVQRGVMAGHPNSLAVLPGTGMTVLVQPGVAVVNRVDATGPYIMSNDAIATVTIPTANATYPRIDLVYMRQQDVGAGDTTTAATFGVITGTPSASPTAPSAMPPGSMELATVAVPAKATSIAASQIAVPLGWRPWTVARGGIQPVSQRAMLSASPYVGQAAFNQATGHLEIWSGTKWNVFTDGAGYWDTYVPLLLDIYGTYVQTGAGVVYDCNYRWVGATLDLNCSITMGTGVFAGRRSIFWPLPAGVTTAGVKEQTISAKCSIDGYGSFIGEAHIAPGATAMTLSFPTSATDNRLLPWRNCDVDASGNALVGTGVPLVPNAWTVADKAKVMVWGTLTVVQPQITNGHFANVTA